MTDQAWRTRSLRIYIDLFVQETQRWHVGAMFFDVPMPKLMSGEMHNK